MQRLRARWNVDRISHKKIKSKVIFQPIYDIRGKKNKERPKLIRFEEERTI